MHRCLYIDEILELIAGDVSANGPRRNLVAMALTCRVFYEPAMNRLWRNLEGLVPLIRCLPRARLSRTAVPSDRFISFTYSINIVGVPLPHEWERLRIHARRIRTLSLYEANERSYSSSLLDFQCYETLRVHYPESPMLPNLHSLYYHSDAATPSLAPYFGHLMSSTLQKVHHEGTLSGIVQALECLQEYATGLRTFRGFLGRSVDTSNPALLTRLTNTLKSFHDLTTLRLDVPYEDAALSHLASLPHLSSFGTCINNSNYQSLVSSKSTSVFPSLQYLEVYGSETEDDIEHIAQFLGNIHPHSLKRLSIHASTPSRPAVAGDLMGAIAIHRTIETLNIALQGGRTAPLPSAAPESLLWPLERLSSLSSIDVHGLPIAFTGPGLGRLAYAWPDLKTFSLRPCWTTPSQVRFCDLIPFAKRCHRLESFAFVAAPHMPPYDVYSKEEHLREALSQPDTFRSPLERILMGSEATSPDLAPHIGSFLADYFPAVRSVLGSSADGRTHFTLNAIVIAKEQRLQERAQMAVGGEL